MEYFCLYFFTPNRLMGGATLNLLFVLLYLYFMGKKSYLYNFLLEQLHAYIILNLMIVMAGLGLLTTRALRRDQTNSAKYRVHLSSLPSIPSLLRAAFSRFRKVDIFCTTIVRFHCSIHARDTESLEHTHSRYVAVAHKQIQSHPLITRRETPSHQSGPERMIQAYHHGVAWRGG